jgi:hypothetical protein
MAKVAFASREFLGGKNCRVLVDEWSRMLGAMTGAPMPAVSYDLEYE